MDLLRRKRQSSSASLPGLAVESASSSSPAGSSPASSLHENRQSSFFTSVKRSFSRASLSPRWDSTDPSTATTAPAVTGPGSPGRRVLHKQTGSFSSFDSMQRRTSVTSDAHRRLSRAYSLSLSSRSATSSTGIDWKTAIDWKTQVVEDHCAIEPDPQVLRSKPSYLIVTQDYLVKMKTKAEALAAFPQIRPDIDEQHNSLVPPPDPVLVVPMHMMVSVFLAESSRPSFGIEFWWRSSSCRAAYCSTQIFFSLPKERSGMMDCIVTQLKAKNSEFPDASLVPLEVEAQIMHTFQQEEPDFNTCKPEIFAVVKRTSVKDDFHTNKLDKARKAQDGNSWYLAVGRNLCYLAEVGPGLPIDFKYQALGLVTLDAFRANWAFHEERFIMTFREPFKPAVTLELASRYYRQIVITFLKADRFLKPCWPTALQTIDVFRIAGLSDPQLLIAGDNYGGLKRTLDAFLSAYHCDSVEWEINWKTLYAPEFRLRKPKHNGHYTNLQLLAVMKALRYNGYFNSISFRDIDLTGLWVKTDPMGRTPLAYVNRNCLALGDADLGQLRFGPLLHQELHALAFCSETIRQIDLSNCFTERSVRRHVSITTTGPGFLSPILNLLEQGLTKCNRLLLSGNYLRPADIEALIEALMTQTVAVQALDISNCGLSDLALRDIFEVLHHQRRSLQVLDVSGNRGRVHASAIASLVQVMLNLKKLDVSGIIMGDIPGPVFSVETLSRFQSFEELDLSKHKVNEATLSALEKWLFQSNTESQILSSELPGTPSASCGAKSTLRRLALNNCGINGREAARLIRALSNHTSVHLHISGNPLEDGITDLCRAISMTSGPIGLHMNMLEFRHEANFVALMKALAYNRKISTLSLAGTAPTPSADGPCGSEVCDALSQFFERNRSVKYLDLSGYSGKLDEGQLGQGFAQSLRGLVWNKTLIHLRIRNQNLHDDVGTLGSVIRQNSTLRIVDCQDNNWNLTSVQFLARSLKSNQSIVNFPFSQNECERVWSRITYDLHGQSLIRKAGVAAEQEAALRTTLQRQVQELRETTQRNLGNLETNDPSMVQELRTLVESDEEGGWTMKEDSKPLSNANLGRTAEKTRRPLSLQYPAVAARQFLQVPPPTQNLGPRLDLDLESDLMITPSDPPVADITRKIHEIFLPLSMTVHSDAVDTADIKNPYHIGQDAETLMLLETPPGASKPNGGDDSGRCSPIAFEATPFSSATSPLTTPTEQCSQKDCQTDNTTVPGELRSSWNSAGCSGFDGPYSGGFGRSAASRFRRGGLEAHVEE